MIRLQSIEGTASRSAPSPSPSPSPSPFLSFPFISFFLSILCLLPRTSNSGADPRNCLPKHKSTETLKCDSCRTWQIRRIAKDVPDSFTDYVRAANLRIGEAQARALEDTMKFYEDPNLDISQLQKQVTSLLITLLYCIFRRLMGLQARLASMQTPAIPSPALPLTRLPPFPSP
jgi:hypothetical protein